MNRKLWRSGLTIGLCMAMAAIGCTPTGNGNNKEVRNQPAPLPKPKTDTVVIENMQFGPAQLNILAGDTVIWINKGIVTHNVTEDTAQTWTSGDIKVGDSWKTIPEKSFKYLCTVHPTMKGSVTVTPR